MGLHMERETRARTCGGGGAGSSRGAGAGGSHGSGAGAGGTGTGAGAFGGHPLDDDVADADAPSELLGLLLEHGRDVLVKEVLGRLDSTDCALLSLVGKPWMAVVVASGALCAGTGGAPPLKLEDFVGSVERLAWAKSNARVPWNKSTCAVIAGGGRVEVLQWAREHGCPWNASVCAYASARGTRRRAAAPLMPGTWRCCSGLGSEAARGTG